MISVSFKISKKDEIYKISTLNDEMPLRFKKMCQKPP